MDKSWTDVVDILMASRILAKGKNKLIKSLIWSSYSRKCAMVAPIGSIKRKYGHADSHTRTG